MNVLDDPRVSVKPGTGFAYRIEGGPTGYGVTMKDAVTTVHGTTGAAGQWMVFNGYGVWIGATDHPLVDANEVDAKGVYPTAEAAIAAVLAGLDVWTAVA